MKKPITYNQLQRFDIVATNYLIREGYFNPHVPAIGDKPAKRAYYTDKPITKLVANIKNVIKQGDKLYETFNEKQNNILIDNATVDEKTNAILYDDSHDAKGNLIRNYRFTKDQQKEVNKQRKNLLNETVEIHSRITNGEFDLTEEEKEAFSGIVIPEVKEDGEMEYKEEE